MIFGRIASVIYFGICGWLLPHVCFSQDTTFSSPLKHLAHLPGETLEIAGRPVFILLPPRELRTIPQAWVMYAPALPSYPDQHEGWMHERFLAAGLAVAGIDAGEAYGSPQGQALMDALYRELTLKRGFSPRPCLLGRSRGGLWVSSWAIANPDRVAGIAGIYPVFDLQTYPGLEKAAPAYGLSPQTLKDNLVNLNPIERIDVLAKARVPICIIHGDQDDVVPIEQNSAALADRYRQYQADSAVELIVAKGQGHNYWDGFFRSQPLIDFVIARAKSGVINSQE